MITCGRGHQHETTQQVRECYGVAHLENVRDSNFIPAGPAPAKAGAKANAERIEEGKRQAALARAGKPHSYTSKCPACVAGTCQRGAPQEPLNIGYSERQEYKRTEPEPSGPQLRFLGSLLRKHMLIAEKGFIEGLTKRTASLAISILVEDDLPTIPTGLKRDPGRMSADGDPEGMGSPNHGFPHGQHNMVDNTPMPDVPQGYYAIPSITGANDLDFFRVDRKGEDGKSGRTYVMRVIGGHPDTNIRFSQYRQVLEGILEVGIEASGNLYADNLERCKKCNRHLTDEDSRKYRMGSTCRAGG